MIAALVAALAAPPVYATHNYGLTFETPPGLTYCPLPKDWVGSDHGTTLFLVPPADCGGAGYPSSDRGYAPAETPRIEIYYEYAQEGWPPARRCPDRVRFVGRRRPLCRGKDGALATLEVSARYEADGPVEVTLHLATTPARLAADRRVFEALARSVRPCRVRDFPLAFGAGKPCPDVPWF